MTRVYSLCNVTEEKVLQDRGDDFWHAVTAELGGEPISPQVRGTLERERLFQLAREAWAKGDAQGRRSVLDLLTPWVRSASSIAGLRFQETTPMEPEATQEADTPAWWRPYVESRFMALRHLRDEAATILGLKGDLSPVRIESVLATQRVRERQEGDSLSLHYPAVWEQGGRLFWGSSDMVVYRGYYADDSTWHFRQRDRETLERAESFLKALSESGTANRALTDEMRCLSGEMSGHSENSAVDPAQPLSRLVGLQSDVCTRTGCAKNEATGYLLTGAIPRLPMVRAYVKQRVDMEESVARQSPDGVVHVRVMSMSVPTGAISHAYSRLVGLGTSTIPSQPRRAVRSPSPILAADLVRDCRQRAAAEGHSASWSEMWEAFRALHPDAYGSLESFRQTVYRQLGPSRKSGRP